ncbi:hypothetical protein KIN20_021215 [Parelaphostrongylus tenuis]|uniref:Uncharacterized protein n=1 Tax=Parelaphostrongylus tenuis TaxID=148309 RepID=A0AAD5MSD2_PARTN|nr:hypothetical protein KIN20_021215 [Parelaphostrongylus tenuis]
MPLPRNYEDRLWITEILGQLNYEEAIRLPHHIDFRPIEKDHTADFLDKWAFKVQWELFNGDFIETWKIEDRLVHLKEININKERNNIVEGPSENYRRYYLSMSTSDEDQMGEVCDEDEEVGLSDEDEEHTYIVKK